MILRLFFALFLILASCNSNVLVLHQQTMSPAYLASINVGSPDPRPPPKGEMVVAEWGISNMAMDRNPSLVINLLFKNYTTETLTFPICSRVGYEAIQVIGEEFKETGGLLAYKAEIITEDGQLYAEWQHQLWVNLIEMD